MKYFFDRIIKPYIVENGYKDLLEIGAGQGGDTDKLLSINSVNISVVDPCLDTDLCARYKDEKRVRVFKGLSLEILPKIAGPFDCIFVDGDHNWYTVFHELKTIEERKLIKEGGTIFLHDVCWPYGRRDMYYVPESIPEKFRHPYAKKGVEEKKSELSETSAMNCDLNNAVHEGGPRNGVLTAVEDFLSQFGQNYLFYYLTAQHGLGFLIRKKDMKTRVMALKWFLIVKHREFFKRIISFIEHQFPDFYAFCCKCFSRIR